MVNSVPSFGSEKQSSFALMVLGDDLVADGHAKPGGLYQRAWW